MYLFYGRDSPFNKKETRPDEIKGWLDSLVKQAGKTAVCCREPSAMTIMRSAASGADGAAVRQMMEEEIEEIRKNATEEAK